MRLTIRIRIYPVAPLREGCGEVGDAVGVVVVCVDEEEIDGAACVLGTGVADVFESPGGAGGGGVAG